jgi:hypothetical protein
MIPTQSSAVLLDCEHKYFERVQDLGDGIQRGDTYSQMIWLTTFQFWSKSRYVWTTMIWRTMEATTTLCSYQVMLDMQTDWMKSLFFSRKATHKIPVAKTAMRPNLRILSSCSWARSGSGITRMTRSVKMLTPPAAYVTLIMSTQEPPPVHPMNFHTLSTGLQLKHVMKKKIRQ